MYFELPWPRMDLVLNDVKNRGMDGTVEIWEGTAEGSKNVRVLIINGPVIFHFCGELASATVDAIKQRASQSRITLLYDTTTE
jgi:hypothetical protein